MTDRTYSLPSKCEKLVKDLEHTNHHHPIDSMTRRLKTWNNLCCFYIDNKEKFKLSVEHDFISSVDLYNLPLNQFPYRCDINGGNKKVGV
jgi:hypothetical protein